MTDKGARIMIVDDEQQIRKLIRVSLTAYGYDVFEAQTGEEALRQVALIHPELIILDLGLPDIRGQEVVKRVREWSNVPIIVLSVCNRDTDKINLLDSGADDYITKPFSMGELFARIRVCLRHLAKTEDEPIIKIGNLTLDLVFRRITVDGEEVKLTPIEYDILKQLAINAGRVVTHRQLLSTIWGKKYEAESQYLRVYIGQLRRKIEKSSAQPKLILTEPGVGYRLSCLE